MKTEFNRISNNDFADELTSILEEEVELGEAGAFKTLSIDRNSIKITATETSSTAYTTMESTTITTMNPSQCKIVIRVQQGMYFKNENCILYLVHTYSWSYCGVTFLRYYFWIVTKKVINVSKTKSSRQGALMHFH